MVNTPDCTVVGVFANAADAKAAAAELRNAGFNLEDIYLSSESEQHPHEHAIRDWFVSVFGSERHAHRVAYEHALAHGKTIVSVTTPDAACKRASRILASHSPIEVSTDDHVSGGISTPNTYEDWEESATQSDLSAREEMRALEAGRVRVYPRVH